MNALPEEHRPKSDDPDFWAVWSGEGLKTGNNGELIERGVNWKQIADNWQQISTPSADDAISSDADGEK
jgi:hypothetical protein